MRRILVLLSLVALTTVAGCSSKFKKYNGPEVTEVFVFKETRKMYLMHHDKALAEYDIDLGFAPDGHKTERGDGRTPEGTYYIDRRNPDSAFHLSLGINYPNAQDRQAAKEAGVNPGGDIFIHGGPTRPQDKGKADWTAGCIAVTNKEIEDVYAMVRDGTPIHIVPVPQPVATPIPDAALDGAALGEAGVISDGVEIAPEIATPEAVLSVEELSAVEDVMSSAPIENSPQIVVIGGEVDLIGEGDPVQ